MHRTSSHQPATAICTGCSLQFAPPPPPPSSSPFRGVQKTCCVCQSSTNFEGRKLITGNRSILHRVTKKKGERLFFLLLPIAQERLPGCRRRAVILPADTSVQLLQTTPKTRLLPGWQSKQQQLISGVFPGRFGNSFSSRCVCTCSPVSASSASGHWSVSFHQRLANCQPSFTPVCW